MPVPTSITPAKRRRRRRRRGAPSATGPAALTLIGASFSDVTTILRFCLARSQARLEGPLWIELGTLPCDMLSQAG